MRRGEMTRMAYRKAPLTTFLYVGPIAVRHEDYRLRAGAGPATGPPIRGGGKDEGEVDI